MSCIRHNHSHTSGYSFVEVLVAIAILLISIVGPLTIASTGLKNATFAREQSIASFLAQEGIEGVVYFREAAGLQNEDAGTDSWAWVSDLPASCFNGNPCRFDVDTMEIEECSPIGDCDVYLRDSGDIRYLHGHVGTETPFRRMLYFTATDAHTLHVRSVVEWQSNAFASTRSVTLETYLSDIYEN